jgi:imidazolonepropionase
VVEGGLGSSFAIVNATIVTMLPLSKRSGNLARVEEDDLGIVRRATLVAVDGRIESIGNAAKIPSGIETIDAKGGLVMPGFVDAHTHALFAGDRIADFEALAAGSKPSLGIRYTMEQTRRCSQDELVAVGAARLAVMTAHGTTTAEVKTGYALTADGEVAMLRAMAALDARAEMPHVIATFCGAHALPPEFDDYDAFVEELIARVLPRVVQAGIAKFADAFCETGYFSVAQSERFLRACAGAGLRLRLHADELAHSGGALLAAKLRCASADHLNYADAQDIESLAGAGCVAVLCPATTEYLGLDRYAPARDLIAAGVPVALATDFNPGTSPSPSLQVVAHLARRRLNLTAPEAIAGVTLQAARSLGAPAGVLSPGVPADVVMLETADYREFGYYYGVNVVRSVARGRPNHPGGF